MDDAQIQALLKKHGLQGVNKPKLTPQHPKKKGVVLAKEGDTVKLIRFGAQGYKHNYSPEGRKAFKIRHAKNIAKGRLSAAYWADKVLWAGPKQHKVTKEDPTKKARHEGAILMGQEFKTLYERLDRKHWRLESSGLKVGDVVHYKGQRRRYVVVAVDQFGHLSISALSGGPRGSNPTAVKPNEVMRVDEPVKFVGKKAEWLLRRARTYLRQHQQLGSAPHGSLAAAQNWQVEGDFT